MLNETTPAARLLFTQGQRLKTPEQFQRVYDRKKSASDSLLIVYVCENDGQHPRLGVSVSKKVGGAVQRNRVKRVVREVCRRHKSWFPTGSELVFVAKRSATTLDFAAAEREIERLCARYFRS